MIHYMGMKIFMSLKKDFWFWQKYIENITYKQLNLFYSFRKRFIACLKLWDLLNYNIQLHNKENENKTNKENNSTNCLNERYQVKGIVIYYRDMWTMCSHYVIILQQIFVAVLNEVEMDRNWKTCSKRLTGCGLQYVIKLFK